MLFVEGNESWITLHSELLDQLLIFIAVDSVKLNFLVGLSHFVKNWFDHLARPTPISININDHGIRTFKEGHVLFQAIDFGYQRISVRGFYLRSILLLRLLGCVD